MQEFITKVAQWVVAVDPAALKWSAAVLLAVFCGLVLFGLVQYQAYDRKWGLYLVLGLAGGALVAGLGASLHWTLGVLYGVGYGLTWLAWVLTRRLTGWRQHVLRGLAAAVCLGPWLFIGQTECGIVRDFWSPWGGPRMLGEWVLRDSRWLLVFLLTGVVWLALLVGAGSWWRAGRQMAGGQPKVTRWAGLVALVVVNLLGLNWYVAGRFDAFSACRDGRLWTVGYVVVSRPGSTRQLCPDGGTLLHSGAYGGHVGVLQVLLAAGAEVNAKDNNIGWTSLHWAAQNGRAEMVKVLLAAGAEVDAQEEFGSTPLHYAAEEGHAEVVKGLIAAGAAVNTRSDEGWTPLHGAAKKGAAEVVKLLLAAGAEVNVRDNAGSTPLHYAAGHTEVVKLLLAAGAEVNTRPNDHGTPLHWAAFWGHAEGVKLLLAASVEVNARDKEGQTALDSCRKSPNVSPERKESIEELLLQHGGKTGAELDGETATPPAPPPTAP